MTATDTAASSALIPGRLIRIVAILATGSLFAASIAASGITPHPALIIAMVALAVGCGYLPDTSIPLLACLLAVAVLMSGEVQMNVWLVCLPALLHATHLSAALGAVIPASARVERRAIVPSLRRFALAQVIALPVIVALGQFVI
jgi:hypothetical protein